jgi:integrase
VRIASSGGVHVKTLQRMLGHKTATLTLDRYGHLFPVDLDAAGKNMDSAVYPLRTGDKKKAGQLGDKNT